MSIIHLATVVSPFFKVADDGNDDGVFAPSWRWWLQTHRAMARDPKRLASRHPIDMRAPDWPFKSREVKLRALGLEPRQIAGEPTHVYTLRIADLASAADARAFVRSRWVDRGVLKRRVYRSVPKAVLLTVGGEFAVKSDPLYARPAARGGRVGLLYGAYESRADADRDRRVLERSVGKGLTVAREPVTREFVLGLWLDVPAGSDAPEWESGR